MTFGRELTLLTSITASLAGCGVEIREAFPHGSAVGGDVVKYDFIASTESVRHPKKSEPKLLRAAARHCGLPDTQIARESIRHSGAYGIVTTRMMQFACPVPERDMK